MNNAVGPKFILKFLFGWILWVCEQYHKTHIFLAKCTNANMLFVSPQPNHLLSS